MNQVNHKKFNEHLGYCVILCQCIEHSLAILTRDHKSLDKLEGRQFFEELAIAHTKPLEYFRRKLESQAEFQDILPELTKVIDKRNKMIHRAIVSQDIVSHIREGNSYDYDSDIELFSSFQSKLDKILDEKVLGTAGFLDEALAKKVEAALHLEIEINRSKKSPTRLSRQPE